MSPSGCDPPSRKLNALAAWSSMYSVIQRFQLPVTAQKVMRNQTEQRLSAVRFAAYVPLLMRPHLGRPPLPALAPRAIRFLYGVTFSSHVESLQPVAFSLHQQRNRRTTAAHRHRMIRRVLPGLRIGHGKPLQREAIRLMPIAQSRASDTFFPDQRGDAGQRYVQPRRLRQLWSKQAKLHLAAISRLGADEDAHHTGRRRRRLQIEVQQLQQDLSLRYRQCRLDRSVVFAASLEAQLHGHARQRQGAIPRSQDKLVEHRSQHEQQRVQQLHRRVELDALLQRKDCFLRHHKVRILSSRQQLQTLSLLSQAHYHVDFRQSRQFAQRLQSPQRQHVRLLLRKPQRSQRQPSQLLRFFAPRKNYRRTYCRWRDTDSSLKIRACRQLNGKLQALELRCNAANNLLDCAEHSGAACHVQHHRKSTPAHWPHFDARRKNSCRIQKHFTRAPLLNTRTPQHAEPREAIQFLASHPMRHTQSQRRLVDAAYLLQRRLAIEHGCRQARRIAAQTQHRLRRKLRHIHADIQRLDHCPCVHAALPLHCPGRSDCGGLRIDTTFASRCCTRWRSTSARYRMPVITLPSASMLPASMRTTSSALLRAQGCCVSSSRLTRVRSHAARNRNHVASGMRHANSAGVLPRSSTIALKPPPCKSRSVARNAWSSAFHGLLAECAAPRRSSTFGKEASRCGKPAMRRGCGSAHRGARGDETTRSPRRAGKRSESTCSSRFSARYENGRIGASCMPMDFFSRRTCLS